MRVSHLLPTLCSLLLVGCGGGSAGSTHSDSSSGAAAGGSETHDVALGGDALYDDDSGAVGGSGVGGGDGDVGATADDAYFPPTDGGVWETVEPSSAGFSESGLDALRQVVEDNRSSSFTIVVAGRLVVEWYFMGAKSSTRTDVASVQKSVTSTLVGLARDRGLLQLDDLVSDHLTAGWSKATPAQEEQITLRHLLTHSSGLEPDTLEWVAPPGTLFAYNTEAYQKLRSVLEESSGMYIYAFSREWLFDAIGVEGEWVDRGEVDPLGAPLWGLELSALDMARYGLFAAREGRWSGAQITSPGWFAEAWTPSATKADYGLLWWLQGRGKLHGKAPADLVSALGARDQKIYVVPSLDLVVTRQGLAAGTQTEAESDFDLVLLKAVTEARVPQ